MNGCFCFSYFRLNSVMLFEKMIHPLSVPAQYARAGSTPEDERAFHSWQSAVDVCPTDHQTRKHKRHTRSTGAEQYVDPSSEAAPHDEPADERFGL